MRALRYWSGIMRIKAKCTRSLDSVALNAHQVSDGFCLVSPSFLCWGGGRVISVCDVLTRLCARDKLW